MPELVEKRQAARHHIGLFSDPTTNAWVSRAKRRCTALERPWAECQGVRQRSGICSCKVLRNAAVATRIVPFEYILTKIFGPVWDRVERLAGHWVRDRRLHHVPVVSDLVYPLDNDFSVLDSREMLQSWVVICIRIVDIRQRVRRESCRPRKVIGLLALRPRTVTVEVDWRGIWLGKLGGIQPFPQI